MQNMTGALLVSNESQGPLAIIGYHAGRVFAFSDDLVCDPTPRNESFEKREQKTSFFL
jgi:hypothetical protein